VNDDQILHGLSAAARREEHDLAQLEAEPLDELAVERALVRLRVETGGVRSGVVAHPKASRRWARSWTIGATVAAAAATLLVLWHPAHRQPDLPEYTIALLAGGAETERALPSHDTPLSVRIRPGGSLDVVARPATRVAGPVEARAYLVHDGHASPWDAAIEIAPGGSAHVHGMIGGQVDPSSGTWSLAILVAPAGSLPGDAEKIAGSAPSPEGGTQHVWQLSRVSLVGPRPP
jgi:hypothetical protein